MAHKKSVTLKEAKEQVARSLSKEIKSKGFEHREVGGKTVNILFYVTKYEEIGFEYRMDYWVDGVAKGGIIL